LRDRLFFYDETRLDPSDLRGQALGALAADTTTLEAERAIRFLVGAQMNWGKAGRPGFKRGAKCP
jgi:hypothetical protein